MPRIIVAYTKDRRVIGKDNALPWKRLRGDLVRFKRVTLGTSIVYGRKTWESLGCRILEGRQNIVISKSLPPQEGNPRILGDFDKAVFEAEAPVFIIGGESIFRQALNLNIINEVIATEVYEDCDGDTYFPKLEDFVETSREPFDGYDLVYYQKGDLCLKES